eukprot:COSAG02_NODE_9782_length_2111_cov_15.727602_1_plen_73_part_10
MKRGRPPPTQLDGAAIANSAPRHGFPYNLYERPASGTTHDGTSMHRPAASARTWFVSGLHTYLEVVILIDLLE